MRRSSPLLVLLLAAGCAQAGISDWLNPFNVFGGKKQPGGPAGAASSAVQHSPQHSGHRGTRQLYSSGAPSGPPHAQHGPVPAPQLGSPPGHLDDGFKPSFPPGFANPPSHSPNLNPFATIPGQGAETLGKGPFLPSQLTTYHTPNAPPHTPLVKPAPAPAPGGVGLRPRGRFPFGGGKGRRPQAVPPHAAVDTGSATPDGTGPVGPDGAPMPYSDFPGLSSPISAPSQQEQHPEYEETPTTPPESAPRPQRPSLFSRLTGRHHRPAGRPSHLSGGRNPYGGPQQHHQYHGGPHAGGPPSGPPSGPDGVSFLDGNQETNPFAGNNPLSGLNGPQNGGRPGSDIFYASSPGGNSPFNSINQGPQGPSPFGNPSSGGPPQYSGPQPGGPSPFANPQSGGSHYNGAPAGYRPGPGPSPHFGGGDSGPQQGPPGGPSPQNFFASNGNDYPEQFEGGPRDVRQPQGPPSFSQGPSPYGPPESAGADEQNSGFYGALHSENGPQSGNFFAGQNGPGAPPSYDSGSPYGSSPAGISGNPGIYGAPAPGGGQPGFSPAHRPRKPPVRSFLRNPLAAFSHAAPTAVQPAHGYGLNPLAMSASSNKPATLPVPKGSRLFRPFQRKSGGPIPLSSPKDPNYRPMRLGASTLNPMTAAYEPDTVIN